MLCVLPNRILCSLYARSIRFLCMCTRRIRIIRAAILLSYHFRPSCLSPVPLLRSAIHVGRSCERCCICAGLRVFFLSLSLYVCTVYVRNVCMLLFGRRLFFLIPFCCSASLLIFHSNVFHLLFIISLRVCVCVCLDVVVVVVVVGHIVVVVHCCCFCLSLSVSPSTPFAIPLRSHSICCF